MPFVHYAWRYFLSRLDSSSLALIQIHLILDFDLTAHLYVMGKQAEQDAPCVRYCKIIVKHTKDCFFSWSFLVFLLASWQKFVTPIWKRIFCYLTVARLDMANSERNIPFQRWKYPSPASASGNSIDLQNLNVYLCFFIPSIMLGIWVCTISATAPLFAKPISNVGKKLMI